MSIEITVPRLGWSMEEGTFLEWLVAEGATVRKGQPLFLIEGEKAVEEVASLDEGVLRLPADGPRAGDTVRVGQVLAYLTQQGEAAPSSVRVSSHKSSQTGKVVSPVVRPQPPASPAVRRLARQWNIDLSRVEGTGPGGRIEVAALRPIPTAESTARPISPRARRVARELGIDWGGISGSGRAGRVRERDIRAAGTMLSHTPMTPDLAPDVPGSTSRLSPLRRTIAERLSTSASQTVPVTLMRAAEAEQLVACRERWKTGSDSSVVPSYTDLLVKLVAHVLRDHPLVMAQWRADRLFHPKRIDVGISVDTLAGLVVPVIRDVPARSLAEVALESSRLVELARSRRLVAADMRGGVFTISNLGGHGVDAFTPRINPPETAILGVGRIARQPVVVKEAVVVRWMVTLSLTFDHRVLDGAPAARFLADLCQAIETYGAREEFRAQT